MISRPQISLLLATLTPADAAHLVLQALLPWVLLGGAISIFATVFRLFILPPLKGRLGEALINFWVRRRLDPGVYRLMRNVMLPSPDGTTQIDHVIVSRYGIFVVETKTYKGWIYGGERDPQWTQVIFRRKERFQNPLHQNFKHIRTLSELTGIPERYFHSLVVFAGDCTFKTSMPENVVYLRDFLRYIRRFQIPIIKDSQVPEIESVIRAWAGTVSRQQRATHVARVRGKKAPAPADGPAPACPRCGETMVLRAGRTEAARFWGCSRYPACRGRRRAL